jgi:hypothetical protein
LVHRHRSGGVEHAGRARPCLPSRGAQTIDGADPLAHTPNVGRIEQIMQLGKLYRPAELMTRAAAAQPRRAQSIIARFYS